MVTRSLKVFHPKKEFRAACRCLHRVRNTSFFYAGQSRPGYMPGLLCPGWSTVSPYLLMATSRACHSTTELI